MDEPPSFLSQNIDYNSFFYPNICHVCKSTLSAMECISCHMIYYCSEDHRIQHEEQHQEICQVITNLKIENNIFNFCPMGTKEWNDFKMKNICTVTSKIQRDLQTYEKEMFLWAACCFVCNIQENLYEICQECVLASVCFEHKDMLDTHICDGHNYYLDMMKHNMFRVNRNEAIPKTYVMLYDTCIKDMVSFIQVCVHRDIQNWILDDYIDTDDLSDVLTLLYALKKQQSLLFLQTSDSIVVHIIAGKKMDIRRLSTWEIILHELFSKTLIVVMIQPELQDGCYSFETCKNCRYHSKTLKYKSHRALYHQYVNSSLYLKPDIILAYDVTLRQEKSSQEIIKACQGQYCPLLLTAKSEDTVDDNIICIQEILQAKNEPFLNEENKFSSFKLERDNENQCLRYFNKYLVYYINLNIYKI